MFPESFAARWIEQLTKPADVVLDPFCGRGTLPFQALLLHRQAVGCDVNPVAYCVSHAKTNSPSLAGVLRRISILEGYFDARAEEAARQCLPAFFAHAYRPAVVRQLLFLRKALKFRLSNTDCMLAALILGSLHGESSRSERFLSNQMPHTISTKPAYSVKFWANRKNRAPKRDVFELLRMQARYRYETPPPNGRALMFEMDMRELPRLRTRLPTPIRCAITSPPYFNVTSYEEDQWLRLWFLGGPPYPRSGRMSGDGRHRRLENYWMLIGDMWRVLGTVLAPRADVVVRLGAVGVDAGRLIETLSASAQFSQRRVQLVQHEVSELSRRQTGAFRPGSTGCKFEVDCHFTMN
jgi:hypothetical protein